MKLYTENIVQSGVGEKRNSNSNYHLLNKFFTYIEIYFRSSGDVCERRQAALQIDKIFIHFYINQESLRRKYDGDFIHSCESQEVMKI